MNIAAPALEPQRKGVIHQRMKHRSEARGKKTFVPASSQTTTSCACGGSCPHCQKKTNNLNISQPNDSAEIQADQVAHKIMQMPAQESLSLPRSHHSAETIQRKCDSCTDEEEKIQRKPLPSARGISAHSPEHVKSVLSMGGKQLDPGTRGFFESRFDRDFSNVRVHTGAAAVQSSRDLNARAYTLGHNVIFGDRQFAPETHEGRSLLAHELTHVIQQSGGGQPSQNQSPQRNIAGNSIASHISSVSTTAIHRACGSAEIGEPTGCVTSTSDVSGLRYLFQVNCDDFATGNEDDLRMDAAQIQAGDIVDIHGLASSDGDAAFNMNLSCARALRAREVIASVLSARGISATINVFNHGATPGDATQQRSVVISRQAATPQVDPPTAQCANGTKTITIDFVRLHGSSVSPTAQLAVANTVFSGCCVRFIAGATPPQESQATTEAWLGGDTDVDRTQGAGCGNIGGEEQAMFDGATSNHNLSSRMRVFFVSSFSTSGLAYSIPPYCATGVEAPYVDHAVLGNNALSDTLAHELGHILINSRDHTGIDNPADTRNLMFAPGRTASDLDASQCAAIYRNA